MRLSYTYKRYRLASCQLRVASCESARQWEEGRGRAEKRKGGRVEGRDKNAECKNLELSRMN